MPPARSGPALKEAPRAETAEALPSTPLPLLGLEVGQADGAGGRDQDNSLHALLPCENGGA